MEIAVGGTIKILIGTGKKEERIDALLFFAAILIIQIDFLKARQWRAFKKSILVFPAPSALETPKSVS